MRNATTGMILGRCLFSIEPRARRPADDALLFHYRGCSDTELAFLHIDELRLAALFR